MGLLKTIRKNFRSAVILILALTTVGVYVLTLFTIYISVSTYQNNFSGIIDLATDGTITTIFTGFIAVGTLILAISGIVYIIYPRPKVFAHLREEKSAMLPSTMKLSDKKWISYNGTIEKRPMLGVYVENAGRSVAWNGNVKIVSPSGKILYEDVFTRLRPMDVYEYPTKEDLPIDDSVNEHRKVEVKINYEDENKKRYRYKTTIGIPKENRFIKS